MPRQRTRHRRTVRSYLDGFPESLERLKEATGLSWAELARRIGTDTAHPQEVARRRPPKLPAPSRLDGPGRRDGLERHSDRGNFSKSVPGPPNRPKLSDGVAAQRTLHSSAAKNSRPTS